MLTCLPMPLALVLSPLAVLGCGGGSGRDPGGDSAHVVMMGLLPKEVLLPPGGTQRFTATVEGASDPSVRWSATGGSLTREGLYTAPEQAGTYSVRATSVVDPRWYAESRVTVSEPMPSEPPDPWEPLGWTDEQPEGYDSDVYRWLDADRKPRTAVLTRNEARDPGGSHGGMLRQYRIHVDGQERVATGTGAGGLWNGWGYVVSHYDKRVARTADLPGRHRQVFVGRHHALHELSWELPIGDTLVKVTVHWLFATGRSHPVYAITFDSHAAAPNGLAVSADSRAPYGAINWDGDGTDSVVDGVRWGDKYRFSSLDEPLTAQSRWDYSEPNVVPYAMAYSRSADAEMGAVQTVSWKEQNTGSTWFHDNWGRTSDNPVDSGGFGTWRMPANWNWPYQLCQYELDDTQPTRSKRIAWGLMYGAVGRHSYWGYGYERRYSSHPYQSYSVFMVMGRQSRAEVLAQVGQVERMLRGMGGVPARLSLDGNALRADQDYFASFDASADAVWLTLNGVWSGSHTLDGRRF